MGDVTTPVASPQPTVLGSAGAAASTGGTLPRTGEDTTAGLLLPAGAALVLGGLGIELLARRRNGEAAAQRS